MANMQNSQCQPDLLSPPAADLAVRFEVRQHISGSLHLLQKCFPSFSACIAVRRETSCLLKHIFSIPGTGSHNHWNPDGHDEASR